MLQGLQSRRNLLVISVSLLVLTATLAALSPKGTRADEGVRIQAIFTVTYAGIPNTAGASFCGGPPMFVNVEAHGGGSSTFGPLSFSLHKTVDPASGAAHGCLQLIAPNGDILDAIYNLNLGAPNDHQFALGTGGTLAFTGGTGRFQGASGSAKLTAVFANFYPASSFVGGTSNPLQGVAVYSVDGILSAQQSDQ
jgi:hypothetical protein